MSKKAGWVTGVRPTMSQILVEMLSAQEAVGTRFTLTDKAEVGAPQGYIIELGPRINPEDVGFKVGDRVLLQGSYVPVPKLHDSSSEDRKRGLVEIHNVKAILEESSILHGA